MRHLLVICIFLLASCSSDEPADGMPMDDTPCGVMDAIGFSVVPQDESVLLQWGAVGHFDGPFRSCSPEAFEVYEVADDGQSQLLAEIEGSAGTFLVEGLENGDIHSFKVIALHNELESVQSAVRTVRVGLIPLPQISDFPLALPQYSFELFFLAPDGDRFLYRNGSDDWYVSSFSNPATVTKVVDDSFLARWNPHQDNEVIYREKQYIQIASNTNGVTSKSMTAVNIDDGSKEVLHEISDYMDFGTEHKPEQYWIHSFAYSADGQSIYFESNKDNGSTTLTEKKVYNNIWRLDRDTKVIEPLSDFLPIEFEMKTSVEDPKSPGNFYVLGGIAGEVVEIPDAVFNPEKVDVYYYNTADQSLTLVLETIYEEEFLDINPAGDQLLIVNSASGREEIWSYNLATQDLRQVTQSVQYRYTKHQYYPNWISDTEFMVSVYFDSEPKLAVFKI